MLLRTKRAGEHFFASLAPAPSPYKEKIGTIRYYSVKRDVYFSVTVTVTFAATIILY